MKTIYSDDHQLHRGRSELSDGKLVPSFECPERADTVLAAVTPITDVIEPKRFGLGPVRRIHADNYVAFLEKAWSMWAELGRDWDALPLNWAVRGMRQIEPDHIDGKFSYFSFDAGTPITPGSWQAMTTAADVALTGAELVKDGARAAFSLCRPPGHHAAADYFGGYCFLNNAAIAAQYFRDHGAERVAILDVDYHHGNGTQSLFYDRADVMFLSIHGDPRQEYPYFLGYADETGEGEGLGFNHNYPLPWGTAADVWFDAFTDALKHLWDFDPDVVVVSLGVDTFELDPISEFKLKTGDYPKMGEKIGLLGKPTLFVMEGGYAVGEIGENVAGVLKGFGASS
ncbi:MAG: histone deacetylase family protein [Pseudomonadota bacterium]